MRRIALFFLCVVSLFGEENTTYDCIFVGSSPQSLFEALYQHALGKSVLILEEGPRCGGAWQSVDICGVAHADVGCHEIGNSVPLKEFLQEYAGCSLIPLDSGYYFSEGCYELIHNLETRIHNSSIELRKNHRVDRVCYNESTKIVTVESDGEKYQGIKIYAPSYSYFSIGNQMPIDQKKTQYHHLYLLINDPTPPRFAYRHGVCNVSRMMNLTHFVDLKGTGQQLIVFQTWNMECPENTLLAELISQKLLDPAAYILKADWFTYEQYPANSIKCTPTPWFEQMQTFDFRGIANHITRWKEAILPYVEVVP